MTKIEDIDSIAVCVVDKALEDVVQSILGQRWLVAKMHQIKNRADRDGSPD